MRTGVTRSPLLSFAGVFLFFFSDMTSQDALDAVMSL